jgi:2-polyprenyl-6-methoxyphenol hydroxylase-like FAD-dependent oxidoreductase
MRLSKGNGDPKQSLGRINYGRMLVMLDRGDYWQCAYIIRKDGFAAVEARGLPAFRDDLLRIAPFFRDRIDELASWDDIKLLTVAVDRMERWWRPGLLCIGDCAHAMSPMGGVGINLAIQDAIAAANRLAAPLAERRLADADLQAVQQRRMWPTRATQKIQVVMQERVIDRFLGQDKPIRAPGVLRLFNALPFLRRIPARVIGIGIRPEHVEIPERVPRA